MTECEKPGFRPNCACPPCVQLLHPSDVDYEPSPRPPFQLREIAQIWPSIDWLCYLSPQERRWYRDHEPILRRKFPEVPEEAWRAVLR